MFIKLISFLLFNDIIMSIYDDIDTKIMEIKFIASKEEGIIFSMKLGIVMASIFRHC